VVFARRAIAPPASGYSWSWGQQGGVVKALALRPGIDERGAAAGRVPDTRQLRRLLAP